MNKRKIYAINTIKILLRLILASVFFTAGISKILAFNKARIAFQNFKLIPENLVFPLLLLLIFTELLLGLSFFIGYQLKIGIGISVFLLFMFSSVILIVIFRGNSFDCGCFGNLISSKTNIGSIFRNLVISSIAVSLFILQGDKTKSVSVSFFL